MNGMAEKTSSTLAGSDTQPLTVTATILGKKWHPRIVARLLDARALGFNELKKRMEGISDKVLSESLEDLQERNLVERTVIDDKPVRVEYSLTEFGKQLDFVVEAMNEWGSRYLAAHDDNPPK